VSSPLAVHPIGVVRTPYRSPLPRSGWFDDVDLPEGATPRRLAGDDPD
jgi:hypothetical protein